MTSPEVPRPIPWPDSKLSRALISTCCGASPASLALKEAPSTSRLLSPSSFGGGPPKWDRMSQSAGSVLVAGKSRLIVGVGGVSVTSPRASFTTRVPACVPCPKVVSSPSVTWRRPVSLDPPLRGTSQQNTSIWHNAFVQSLQVHAIALLPASQAV